MEFLQGICSLIAWVLGVYSLVILVRIIISWILLFSRINGWRSGNGGYGYNQEDPNHPSGLANADKVLGKICDPYLHMFSGVKFLRRSSLDLTPVLALVLLNFVRSVLGMFADVGSLSLWVILAILVNALWRSLFAFLLFLLIVLLIIRFFLGRSTSYSSGNWINTIDPILDPSVNRVYKLFYKNKQVDDQKIVLTSIIFYAVILVVTSVAVNALVNFLIRL